MYLYCSIEMGMLTQKIYLIDDEGQLLIATTEMTYMSEVLTSLCEEYEIKKIVLAGLKDYLSPVVEDIKNYNKNIEIEVI